jgi:hypothetical protein
MSISIVIIKHKQFVGGGNISVVNTITFCQTFVIPNFQLALIFWLVATLCEGGETPRMGIMLDNDLIPITIPKLFLMLASHKM